jgi:hypothetical protein
MSGGSRQFEIHNQLTRLAIFFALAIITVATPVVSARYLSLMPGELPQRVTHSLGSDNQTAFGLQRVVMAWDVEDARSAQLNKGSAPRPSPPALAKPDYYRVILAAK